jgi:hypothetical protein
VLSLPLPLPLSLAFPLSLSRSPERSTLHVHTQMRPARSHGAASAAAPPLAHRPPPQSSCTHLSPLPPSPSSSLSLLLLPPRRSPTSAQAPNPKTSCSQERETSPDLTHNAFFSLFPSLSLERYTGERRDPEHCHESPRIMHANLGNAQGGDRQGDQEERCHEAPQGGARREVNVYEINDVVSNRIRILSFNPSVPQTVVNSSPLSNSSLRGSAERHCYFHHRDGARSRA